MLKYTVQFQRQIKQQEEINEITKKIPITKSKKEKEEEILSLMKGIKEKEEKILSLMEAIKNLSENTEKTPEQKNILNEMLAMYKEKENELIRDKSALESKLGEIVNHSDEGPSVLIQTQNSSNTACLKQTIVNTENNIQKDLPEGVKHAVSSDNTFSLSQPKTPKLQQDIKKQENQDKPLPTSSGGLGVNDELAKKVAERRALLDKQDNINTGNVSYSKEIVEKQSLKVNSINQKDIQKQHSQTRKQAVNSNNSVPLNHGLNMTEELARIFAERNKISERNNNDTTEKDKVISSITNVSPDEQSKLSERAAVEVQVQKNTDNIAASEQTQNSQDNFSLLENLQNAIKNLKKRKATKETNNLPSFFKEDIDKNKAAITILDELQKSIQRDIASLDKLTEDCGDKPKIVEMTPKSTR